MTQKNDQFDQAVAELSTEESINEALASHLPFAHKLVAEVYRLRKELSDIQSTETPLVPRPQFWYSHEIRNEY